MDHVIQHGVSAKAAQLLSKLLNQKRYPELIPCLSKIDANKGWRKLVRKESTVAPIDMKVNDEDAFSMESSSSCSDEDVVSSAASSRMATQVYPLDVAKHDGHTAKLMAESDRLVQMLSEHKALLLLLIEHATIDGGWRPFIKALVEKKM